MAQLKDLLVNGKSKFLDIITAVGMRLSTGGSDMTFWNTNGGTKTASEIVSAVGSFVTTNTSQTITGQKIFNTNSNTVPLLIGRGSYTTNELLQIGVDDTTVRFKHIQDETEASYEFVGQWTDTESGAGGAAAGSKSIKFNLSNTNHSILVGSNTVLHTGNYSSYALPLDGGTMTGAAPIKFTPDKVAIDFRNADAWHSKVEYMTYGNEALVFANKNEVTSYIFKCGYDLTNTSSWGGVGNPGLQIKQQSVYVNKLITNGTTPSHNFLVSGASRFEGSVNVTNDAANNGCIMSYDSTEECMKFTFN